MPTPLTLSMAKVNLKSAGRRIIGGDADHDRLNRLRTPTTIIYALTQCPTLDKSPNKKQ